MKRILLSSLTFFLVSWASGAARGVVISEIHYNPPAGDEALEFLEVANESSTPEDISGYAFVEGIQFVFPPGTILDKRGYLVICFDLDAFRSRYGIQNALGNFDGRLDAGGDRITLANHVGVTVQTLRFRDRGKWPSGPDGTGHTLALKSVYLDPGEPESWTQSRELGGTPGQPNFPGQSGFEERVLVARGDLWRFARGTGAFSDPETAWREPAFDDTSWPEGPSGFGYGDGDDATLLDDMQNSYVSAAIRKRFQVTAEELAAPGDFYLGIDYDDGFCAHLNGRALAKFNAGTSGVDLRWSDVATGVREAGVEELYKIPRDFLRAGENILAIAGFNYSSGSTDFSLIPRVLLRRPLDPGEVGESPLTLNELYRSAQAGGGWLEIHNRSPLPADLSGFRLTDHPDRPDPHVFPPGTSIPGGGFLVLDEGSTALAISDLEVHLFLLNPAGLVAAASVFERKPPPGVGPGGYSEARFPDGGPLEWVTLTPTRGGPNRLEKAAEIVINEIFYHPPDERAGEFLELYNRGASAADLSGFRFDKGIDYTFEEGVVLQPGGYLVVAEDPDLILQHHGLAGARGPYTGRLANDGENVRLVDRAGNVVDEVRYFEGGSWSRWADGGGSSLELLDPDEDNSFGSAWEASDETEKAEWEELSFHVPNYAVASASELHLYLVERGICHIDDVSIVRGAGANLISNPGFETTVSPWIIQGTHVASRRIETDSHSGKACLELNASGKGDTLVNRIETETSTPMTAGPYDVSLWARWQRGGTLLVAHGEYTAGAYCCRPGPAVNLSGNTLSRGLRLAVPWNLGTPGAENGARARLRASTGSGHLGPVLADFEHRPPSPAAGQPAVVAGRVSASAGIASVRAHFRLDGSGGGFAPADLFDDGLHQDGTAGDGIFGGEIPGQTSSARIVFYIEAIDARGAARRFPTDAPASTLLYQVQGPLGSGFDVARIILDAARTAELQNRPLHSNELLPGAFVFNDEKAYYNVGIRYRGSPWGRPGRSNYRVRFEEDRTFLRGLKSINLDPSGGGANEFASYFLVRRSGAPGRPSTATEYSYIQTWINGGSIGMHGLLQTVDRDFINSWYGDADLSMAYKVEGRRAFDDSGNLTGWDGASFMYRGADPENYRGYFIPAIRRSVDDWTSLQDLAMIMDQNATNNTIFDREIENFLDVDEFLRDLAPRILQADWDAFCLGNGHNGFLVLDPNDGRWELLPWDMDNTFGSTGVNLYPNSDPAVYRLLNRPGPKRIYFRVLWEIINGYWSSRGSGPYFDVVQRATGINTSWLKSHMDTVGAQVRTAVQASAAVAFRIVTNSGKDITTDKTQIQLQGDAPVQLAAILYSRNGEDPKPFAPTWSSPTRWAATFDLPDAVNSFLFFGFDSASNPPEVIGIAVRSTAAPVFVRGDVNGDRSLDLSDVLAGLFHLFHGQAVPCEDAADFDDDGTLTLADAILCLEHLFRGGAPPRPPFPDPGQDPTADGLKCP